MPVELFSEEKAEWYLNSRLQAYISAKSRLPECSPEERWVRPDIFAVFKPGGKRAVRLFDSEAEALAFAENSGGGLYVQKRPGSSIRCEVYCPVSSATNGKCSRLRPTDKHDSPRQRPPTGKTAGGHCLFLACSTLSERVI